jgi:hypothetical protein
MSQEEENKIKRHHNFHKSKFTHLFFYNNFKLLESNGMMYGGNGTVNSMGRLGSAR